MITVENAKKIGITYCADAMGRDFVKKYASNSSTGFSESETDVFCFLGINDKEEALENQETLVLTSNDDHFPYRASCVVSLDDGTIDEFKYIHP